MLLQRLKPIIIQVSPSSLSANESTRDSSAWVAVSRQTRHLELLSTIWWRCRRDTIFSWSLRVLPKDPCRPLRSTLSKIRPEPAQTYTRDWLMLWVICTTTGRLVNYVHQSIRFNQQLQSHFVCIILGHSSCSGAMSVCPQVGIFGWWKHNSGNSQPNHFPSSVLFVKVDDLKYFKANGNFHVTFLITFLFSISSLLSFFFFCLF